MAFMGKTVFGNTFFFYKFNRKETLDQALTLTTSKVTANRGPKSIFLQLTAFILQCIIYDTI